MERRSVLKRSAGLLLFILFLFLQMAIVTEARAENIHVITIKTHYDQTEARRLLRLVNSFRTGAGVWHYDEDENRISDNDLSELKWDYGLERVAQKRAAEAAVMFSHTRPDGSSCFTAYPAGDGWQGENVARLYDSAESVLEAWKETDESYDGQSHRRNLLDRNFEYMAAACVTYRGTCYWAMEFCSEPLDLSFADADDDSHTDSIRVDIAGDAYVKSSTGSTRFRLSSGEAFALPRIYGLFRINGSNRLFKTELPVSWSLSDPSFGDIADGEVTVRENAVTTVHGSFSFLDKDYECDYLLDSRERLRTVKKGF
ncbi:MAG: CAP domain-containing protein [Lachnospiraceae bacterium]|nr:CAP domain-containing protein [Lachnospiraceae bacterium]